jgi:uncharacterized protein YbjT (DUF2867 family)
VTQKLVLVTGASGYIGGRLIPRLLDAGYRVRCLAREPGRLRGRSWFAHVEIVEGDVAAGQGLDRALQGVSTAYYLIHSMASGRGYHARDLAAAHNFAAAAGRARLEQIVYLGGLANPADRIGAHMRSRIQTGEVLRLGSVPVIEFRAGVIVGPGSISFEMIRYLTEQFPLIIGPRWLRNRVQPIAVKDVLAYLLAAAETPASRGGIFEIGGPQVMTFAETMRTYARLRALKRKVLILPVLPLGLMAFSVGQLTPVPASIAAPLIDGMRSDSILGGDAARRVFPAIQPQVYQEAVEEALSRLSPAYVEPVFDSLKKRITIIKHEGFLVDHRQASLEVRPEAAYRAFTQLGGKRGWLYLDGLWQLRGRFDRWSGGPGMRGRRDETELAPGQAVDFYRVEVLQPDRMLRLQAELKAPGEGWMEWKVAPLAADRIVLSQTAYFAPHGVHGYLYWYGLFPIHRLVFSGLFREIVHRAIEIQEAAS